MFPLRPTVPAERWAAALAYIGIGSLAALLWGQSNFVLPHARLAFSLHLSRLLISGFGLGSWYFLYANQGALTAHDLMAWFGHLAGLSVLGLPFAPFGGSAFGLWMAPASLIWLVDVAGIALALQGRAVPGDETLPSRRPPTRIDRGEKERLRRLRDQRLEQIRYATTTGATERLRERQIQDCKRDLGSNLVRLDYLNHLMSIGELSASRYQQLVADVEEEINDLRDELGALGARVSREITDRPVLHSRVAGLGSQLQARTLSISFIDRSGLPLLTFGHFPLDEALIAGMLSAFNSLSQEVFGSPINKTHLAEGQVLYFVHGQWCVLMSLFDAEPSPTQVSRLQSTLTSFQDYNATELQRNPVEPARLVPIGIDFDALQSA